MTGAVQASFGTCSDGAAMSIEDALGELEMT
jgi:hypothetical protein